MNDEEMAAVRGRLSRCYSPSGPTWQVKATASLQDLRALLAEVERLSRANETLTETVRRREADAWDAGCDEGDEWGWERRVVYDMGGGDYPNRPPNPYRAALDGGVETDGARREA